VLEALEAQAPLTLSDLATSLGVPKSSLSRVCAVLIDRGWLVRNRDGRYDLGTRAFGMSALRRRPRHIYPGITTRRSYRSRSVMR